MKDTKRRGRKNGPKFRAPQEPQIPSVRREKPKLGVIIKNGPGEGAPRGGPQNFLKGVSSSSLRNSPRLRGGQANPSRDPEPKNPWKSASGKSRKFKKSSERQDYGSNGGRDSLRRGRSKQASTQGAYKSVKASVDKNRNGFAFLVLDVKGQQDLFVPKGQAASLFHGDRVQIDFDHQGKVRNVKILEHRYKEIVGTFLPRPGHAGARAGLVVYERKNTREEVPIPVVDRMIKSGDWVRVKLAFGPGTRLNPTGVSGQIEEVFGSTLPASADISMIAAEYGCIEQHSSEAIAEARQKSLNESDYKGRADLRAMNFVTIDGATARDFDDAVFVERKGSGFYLWVAIADVSYYVTEGSALDQEAKARGTSVYFPERAFHMLPGALSENLCSLKPNEPRLALVDKMEFDRHGQLIGTELMEAVIQSKRRATYEEIQAEWEHYQEALKQDPKKNSEWEFVAHFALFQILKKVRQDRGSIDFDLPEAEVKCDPQGEVISIENRTRFDAHRLIEEFMIAANESTTQWMMERKLPFIYRVHAEPTHDALERFKELAATAGFNLEFEQKAASKTKGPKSGISPKTLADIVRRLEGHTSQALLNMALLRSMKQAVYTAVHGIHYGLASEGYTHFTSPIRRYPDLVVHRLIRNVLKNASSGADTGKARQSLERQLTEVCEHCSYRERLAADAERETIKLKQVRLMSRHLGEEFDGKIVGMIATGLFVQVASPFVEGMVSSESPSGGEYRFNEEQMVFQVSEKGLKSMIRIGDQVRVQVVRTDLERRQIEFIFK